VGSLLLGGRGRLTTFQNRQKAIELITEATQAAARQSRACAELDISPRTFQRWRKDLASGGTGVDQRKGSSHHVSHRLTAAERDQILEICNCPEYASLPPTQIVPRLADQGTYLASESTFYRILHNAQQVFHRGKARPAKEPRTPPRLQADGPNQLWCWDITYLPTMVKGLWLYLYMIMDVWSRKIIAWDIETRESDEIATSLFERACLKEWIHNCRPQKLIVHSDNGSPMRSLMLEDKLRDLGALGSFSRPRVSNDNPYAESLFRTVKYRPDYPRRPFRSKDHACEWVRPFVEWYDNCHLHSGIKFVTPGQRHRGEADSICMHRTEVYETAKRDNPSRWSANTRCWNQPKIVWINKPCETEVAVA
jgi:putative transposase